MAHPICGLYAITPDEPDTEKLLSLVRAALKGGAQVVQYRNKRATADLRLEQARALCQACREHDKPFIVNDHLDLAIAVEADGLHLGGEDGSIAEARRRLGPRRRLGASCYDRLPLARQAISEGADHVAFGSFFPSTVKPGAVRPPVTLLGDARRQLGVPVVAIGGITLENGASLVAAGADALAVISALFGAADVTRAASDFRKLFEPGNH